MNRRRALVLASTALFLTDTALNVTSGFTGLAGSPWATAYHSFCMGVALAWLGAVYAHLRVTRSW